LKSDNLTFAGGNDTNSTIMHGASSPKNNLSLDDNRVTFGDELYREPTFGGANREMTFLGKARASE